MRSAGIRVWVTLGVGFVAGLMGQQFTGVRVDAQPAMPAGNGNLAGRVAELEAKLANVHVIGDNVIFEGVNVVVLDGSGDTYGTPNGLGNLIVGYDEDDGDSKIGSHNIVVGASHTYTSCGGFVAGFNNAIVGEGSSISGGGYSEASGYAASVSGGAANEASGNYSSISGGVFNVASEYASSVSGGTLNEASGYAASVSGGNYRSAAEGSSWAAGSLSDPG